MSTEYDNKVVSMKFDNTDFEKNVSKTMWTLTALKEQLKFDKVKTGFDDINNSAKKVDFNPMASAVEAVKVKFSAMEVVAITTLANITNQAVNTGKSVAKALTIDPLKDGFREYETQINAVQTILANTSAKGTTIDQVNKALDELNTYADKTIYNFTEMTRNIGTFTAAGIDLKRSTEAIQGIANLAATSGSSAEQASTAMYQLSQALASGTVKLMDWNSVVNAGMGGEVFQNALKDTARKHGVAIDAMIKKEGSFRETLKNEWLTADILTKTLKNFTTSGVNEYLAENSSLSKEAIENIRKESKSYDEAAKAIAGKSKLSQEEIKNLIRMSQVAEDAATKVKTFSQLKDTVKEAVSSGWAQTWRTLIGDFEEARSLFTEVSDVLGGIISKSSDARNKLLEDSMTSSWEKLQKKALDAGMSTESLKSSLIETAKVHGVAIDQMIDKEGSFEKTLKNKWMTSDILAEGIKKASGTKAEETNKLSSEVYVANSEMNNLLATMDKVSGRELLIQSFRNVMISFGRVTGAVGKAWRNIFPRATAEQVYGLTLKLNQLTENLTLSKDSADKLRRTFQGLFSIVNIFTTISTGALKFTLKLLGNLFGIVDLDILGFTAAIGDAATGMHDFLLVNNPVIKAANKLGPVFAGAGKKILSMYSEFKQTPFAVKSMEIISEAAYGFKMAMETGFEKTGETIVEVIKKLKSLDKITFDDIKKALKEVKDTIIRYIVGSSENAAEKVPGALDVIHDAFYRFQENVREHLGTTGTYIDTFLGRLKEMSASIRERFGFGDILGAGLGVGLFVSFKKVLNIIKGIESPLEAVKNVLGDFGGVLQGYQKKLKAEALFTLSKGVLVLAAAMFVVSRIPSDRLFSSAMAIGALTAVLAGVSILMQKLNKGIKGARASTVSLVGIGAALLLLVIALKKISTIASDKLGESIDILGTLIAGIIVISYLLKGEEGTILKGAGTLIGFGIALNLMVFALKQAGNLDADKTGKSLAFILFSVLAMTTIMKVAGKANKGAGLSILLSVVALKVFVKVLEDIGEMDMTGIKRNLGMILVIILMMNRIMKSMSKAGPNAAKAGVGILAMSVSMGILAKSMQIIGSMETSKMVKGLTAVYLIFGLFAALTMVSKVAGQNAIKAGIMIATMTVSLAGITALMVVLGQMDPVRMLKALAAITVMVALFGGLIFITRYAARAKGVRSTLVILTAAIATLVGTMVILSMIKPDGLLTASIAISLIMATFAGVIVASKQISKDYKSILVMVGMTSLLTGLVVALSLLKPKNAIQNALSIAILVGAMTLSITLLSLIGSKAVVGMVVLVGMIAITGLMISLVTKMSKIDSKKALASAQALSELLTVMTVSIGILAIIGVSAPLALIGIAALAALVVGIGGIAYGIGALATKIPDLKKFLNEGIPIMVQISSGLGEMAGGFVKGFLGQVSEALPILGKNLSSFMINLTPFIAISKMIDNRTFSGVKSLCGAMLMLTGTELLAGFSKILGLGSKGSFTSIGDEIAGFGKGYKKFADNVAGINPEATEKAAKGSKYLAEMLDALPLEGGILENFLGKSGGLEAFGQQLEDYAPHLVAFAKTIADMPDGSEKKMKSAAASGKALADMASSLPNEGGALGWWVGNNGMKKFGIQLEAFGPNLKAFDASVSKINKDKIIEASEAGKALADMADSLPNDKGALGWWVGNNGMKDFGIQLKSFGKNLVDFSSNSELVSAEDVARGAEAGTALAKMANLIPVTGGVNGLGIQGFGTELEMFGTSLAKYSESIEKVSTKKMNSIVTPLLDMVAMSRNLQDLKKDNLSVLSYQIDDLGYSVNKMYSNFEDLKTKKLEQAIEYIKSLADIGINASKINQKGITAFNSFVETLSKNSANAFINGFNENKPVLTSVIKDFFTVATEAAKSKSESLKKAFTTPVSEIVQGLKGYADDFTSTGELLARSFKIGLDNVNIQANMLACVSNTITLIRATSDSFYKAGEYCVDGFAKGLMKGKSTSNTAGVQLAKAALDGARKKLEVRSPSRAFGKLADMGVKGYVNHLMDGVKSSYDAGKQLAGASADGLKSTVMKISDFIKGEIELNPIITPVIDLTDFESGSKRIGNLLNYDGTMRVAGRIESNKTSPVNIQNGQYLPGNSQVEYNFNQYNTSPKALSRTDIYRQTKNQFAMLKGVTVLP